MLIQPSVRNLELGSDVELSLSLLLVPSMEQ